ncbi:hypothetical protein RHPLAN_39970 [Rhodoplanes sp. Z2-YC6860]|nr:hypothetical protein RHPLAN_39970 [Rhodoplanes sp. Z2-YC6860]
MSIMGEWQSKGLTTALPAITGAMLALFVSATDLRAQGAQAGCESGSEIAVLPSPLAPWRGAPLRVLFTSEKPLDGELSLIAPDGQVAASSRERHGGPPYFWIGEVQQPAAGKWRVALNRNGAPAGCGPIVREVTVRADRPAPPSAVAGSVWPIRDNWSKATENLFSAWVEKLFDAPLDQELSWPALHEVLRDPSRNLLFNHLGLNEDSMKVVLRPDCADLPYFLRAYFAFKVGLPFGYSKCSRGGGGRAPTCSQWFNIQSLEPPPAPAAPAQAAAPPPAAESPRSSGFGGLFSNARSEPVAASPPPASAPVAPAPQRLGLARGFGQYASVIGGAVHSGSARTALNDNHTDYYPVRLSQETLRPGTVYADPYGHILMIVRRVAQTEQNAGIILAVDGQPDGTVARKRFWRGNFLFSRDPGPGFKRFRPVVRKGSTLVRLTNEEIAKNPQYGDFSLEQAQMSVDDFYDRMDDVMSPQPLNPLTAMKDAIDSLEEQSKVRVTSVENGRKYQNSGRGEIGMPNGAAIFETTGAWEDFSTPSRDLRMLIAIDVVRGYPDRVARRPERYAMPAGKSPAQVKDELQSMLAAELPNRKFSYPRTDGSQWTLSLKDVFDRAQNLEMAYNPNDCVELRWGAQPRSEEASTCKRSASQGQKVLMAKYRPWFAERRRPPRP